MKTAGMFMIKARLLAKKYFPKGPISPPPSEGRILEEPSLLSPPDLSSGMSP